MDDAAMIEAMAKAICNVADSDDRAWKCYIAPCTAALAAIAPAIQAREAEARRKALEEAADLVDTCGEALTKEWRAGGKADSHLEGRGDASDEYSRAIRALIDKLSA